MGINMHMPEAVFGQNCLLITHQKTGRTLSFHVEDALRIWAKQSVEDGSRNLLCPPAQLRSWQKRMVQAKLKTTVDVDWTFDCKGYSGSVYDDEEEDDDDKDEDEKGEAQCTSSGCGCNVSQGTQQSTKMITTKQTQKKKKQKKQQLRVVKSTTSISAVSSFEHGRVQSRPSQHRAAKKNITTLTNKRDSNNLPDNHTENSTAAIQTTTTAPPLTPSTNSINWSEWSNATVANVIEFTFFKSCQQQGFNMNTHRLY